MARGEGDAAPERSRQRDAQIDDRRPARGTEPGLQARLHKKDRMSMSDPFFVSVCPGSPSYPGQHGGKRRTHIAEQAFRFGKRVTGCAKLQRQKAG